MGSSGVVCLMCQKWSFPFSLPVGLPVVDLRPAEAQGLQLQPTSNAALYNEWLAGPILLVYRFDGCRGILVRVAVMNESCFRHVFVGLSSDETCATDGNSGLDLTAGEPRRARAPSTLSVYGGT